MFQRVKTQLDTWNRENNFGDRSQGFFSFGNLFAFLDYISIKFQFEHLINNDVLKGRHDFVVKIVCSVESFHFSRKHWIDFEKHK